MSRLVTADTEYGRVRGATKTSELGTQFESFLGIPYATPPTGGLRFKDPLPPSNWENTYDATEEKSACCARNFYLKKITGSEDCLFLNIFTKTRNPAKPQPVMLYIHGGGFNSGSSTTELLAPDYLLMADVVVVTLNYRLGAFGFLSLNEEELQVPGNAGLKDQLLAMKFVKNNIRNFGGDPDNITLFGHSAGASCVSWHCVSERSKGLFHRAIIMSGCVLNRWSLTPRGDWGYRLATKLGYEGGDDEKDVLAFLQQADAERIVEHQDSLLRPEDRGKVSYAFSPCIESVTTDKTFISERPIELVGRAWSNDIDILIGLASNEGLMYLENIKAAPALLKSFTIERMVPMELNLSSDDPRRLKFVEDLRKAYYPNGEDPTEDSMAFCQIVADQSLLHGVQRITQGRQHSRRSGKTFLYRFDIDSPTQNHYRIARLGPTIRGVCHGDELNYLFKSIYVDVPLRDSMEFRAISRFVSLFTSFATSGDPNDNVLNADLDNTRWHPVDSLDPPFNCLNIGESLTFMRLPESDRLAVWDAMFAEASAPLY